MDVILLQKINKLGNIGDTVTVKQGYGRNFLIPTGKALRATRENTEVFEKSKAKLLEENKEAIETAKKIKEEVEKLNISLVRSASDTGMLYGSVTKRDIANLIVDNGVKLGRKQIVLDRPIKELGSYQFTVALHPEVESSMIVRVVRSMDDTVEGSSVIEDKKTESDSEINRDLLDDGVVLDIDDQKKQQIDEDKKD